MKTTPMAARRNQPRRKTMPQQAAARTKSADIEEWLLNLPKIEDYLDWGYKPGSVLFVTKRGFTYVHQRCGRTVMIGEMLVDDRPQNIVICYDCWRFWYSDVVATLGGAPDSSKGSQGYSESKRNSDAIIVNAAVKKSGGKIDGI